MTLFVIKTNVYLFLISGYLHQRKRHHIRTHQDPHLWHAHSDSELLCGRWAFCYCNQTCRNYLYYRLSHTCTASNLIPSSYVFFYYDRFPNPSTLSVTGLMVISYSIAHATLFSDYDGFYWPNADPVKISLLCSNLIAIATKCIKGPLEPANSCTHNNLYPSRVDLDSLLSALSRHFASATLDPSPRNSYLSLLVQRNLLSPIPICNLFSHGSSPNRHVFFRPPSWRRAPEAD
jgi:hypothetical protein